MNGFYNVIGAAPWSAAAAAQAPDVSAPGNPSAGSGGQEVNIPPEVERPTSLVRNAVALAFPAGSVSVEIPMLQLHSCSIRPLGDEPDLDFAAPEVQSSSACSPQSDMFSFGLLILSLYNNGRSPVESSFSTNTT